MSSLVSVRSSGTNVIIRGVRYCGDRWCQGGCGLDAAFVHVTDGYSYHRDFYAVRRAKRWKIMQPCDPHPGGRRVDLRTVLSAAEVDDLLNRVWR